MEVEFTFSTFKEKASTSSVGDCYPNSHLEAECKFRKVAGDSSHPVDKKILARVLDASGECCSMRILLSQAQAT
jgi:hypothetical protein